MPVILLLRSLGQEDGHEFEANIGYMVNMSQNNNIDKQTDRQMIDG